MTMPGNYPVVDNSNVLLSSMTDEKGKVYAIPTMWDGKKDHTDKEAWARAKRLGLSKFPSFDSVEEAEAWIQKNHGNIVGDKDK